MATNGINGTGGASTISGRAAFLKLLVSVRRELRAYFIS
jgi:hypothetical protein